MPGEEQGLVPGGRGAMAPAPPARAERRAIVSESRVRVSDETEEVPVRDGEVGEADVFGEPEEPEEPGAAGELGEASDAALVVDGAAADGNGVAVDGAAADGAGAPDPVAEFTAELRQLPGEWYVVHSYAGYENRVKANLESRTQSLNMEDFIFQIEVPVHQVIEIKGGKRQQVSEKVLPGYILVRMDLTDESWAVVRNTPGVTGFVGLSSRPSPL